MAPDAAVPAWATAGQYSCVTRTSEELSIICAAVNVPADVQCSRGWRALKVAGPLAFDVVGVAASLAQPLAAANIPIILVGTYDTDYLFVASSNFDAAVRALITAGHSV